MLIINIPIIIGFFKHFPRRPELFPLRPCVLTTVGGNTRDQVRDARTFSHRSRNESWIETRVGRYFRRPSETAHDESETRLSCPTRSAGETRVFPSFPFARHTRVSLYRTHTIRSVKIKTISIRTRLCRPFDEKRSATEREPQKRPVGRRRRRARTRLPVPTASNSSRDEKRSWCDHVRTGTACVPKTSDRRCRCRIHVHTRSEHIPRDRTPDTVYVRTYLPTRTMFVCHRFRCGSRWFDSRVNAYRTRYVAIRLDGNDGEYVRSRTTNIFNRCGVQCAILTVPCAERSGKRRRKKS